MVLEKKNNKRFGSEAQQTVEQLSLEEDLDYRGKIMSVDLENQDALSISVHERENYATWSGGKSSSGQELNDKTKRLKDFREQKGVLQRGLYKEILKERM